MVAYLRRGKIRRNPLEPESCGPPQSLGRQTLLVVGDKEKAEAANGSVPKGPCSLGAVAWVVACARHVLTLRGLIVYRHAIVSVVSV